MDHTSFMDLEFGLSGAEVQPSTLQREWCKLFGALAAQFCALPQTLALHACSPPTKSQVSRETGLQHEHRAKNITDLVCCQSCVSGTFVPSYFFLRLAAARP